MWRIAVVALSLGSLIGGFAIGMAGHGGSDDETPRGWTIAIPIDDRAPAVEPTITSAPSVEVGAYELHELALLDTEGSGTEAIPAAVRIRLLGLVRSSDARESVANILRKPAPLYGASRLVADGPRLIPYDPGNMAPGCCLNVPDSQDAAEAISPPPPPPPPPRARPSPAPQETEPPDLPETELVAGKQPKLAMQLGGATQRLKSSSVADANPDLAAGVTKLEPLDSKAAIFNPIAASPPSTAETDSGQTIESAIAADPEPPHRPDEVSTDTANRAAMADAHSVPQRPAPDNPTEPEGLAADNRSDEPDTATTPGTDGTEQITFKLSAVSVEGATVYTETDFQPLYEHLLDTEVTLDRIFALAKEITSRYGNDGYILSRAIVPAQRITEGVVRIQVVEGSVNEVIVEGDVGRRKGLFRDWAKKIKASHPLNSKVLERYTLLANDLPGATVKAVLQPHKGAPGTTDVVLVVEQKSFGVSGWFDNRAPKTSGPYQGLVSVSGNSLLGFYERTSLTYSAATDREQSQFFGFHHDETLDGEGTVLSLDASHSLSQPGDILKDLGLQSESTSVQLGIATKPIRSRGENLTLSGNLTYRDVDSDSLSARLFRDRLRVVTLGGRYEFTDQSNGINSVGLRLHQGLGILGASEAGDPTLTRADGSGEFTKLTANLSRTQHLGDGFSILLAGTGQLSSVPLLASEEFGVGGAQFGRGYDPSEITGDHGLAGVVELRYTDRPDIPLVNYYQLYTYWDLGMTYDIDAVNQEAKRSAASAGLGVRFGVTDYVSGYLEVAKPLTRPVALEGNGKDPRVFFRLSTNF